MWKRRISIRVLCALLKVIIIDDSLIKIKLSKQESITDTSDDCFEY